MAYNNHLQKVRLYRKMNRHMFYPFTKDSIKALIFKDPVALCLGRLHPLTGARRIRYTGEVL